MIQAAQLAPITAAMTDSQPAGQKQLRSERCCGFRQFSISRQILGRTCLNTSGGRIQKKYFLMIFI
jgi:hypothetical protein